jgi:hypothetical protein
MVEAELGNYTHNPSIVKDDIYHMLLSKPPPSFEKRFFQLLHLELKVLMGQYFVARMSLFNAFALFPVACFCVDRAYHNSINMNLKLHFLPCLLTKL